MPKRSERRRVAGHAGCRSRTTRLALAVAVATVFASPANAIDGDILRARVSAGVTSDSNLFRLPDSVTFPNGTSRSELLSYLSAGLDFDRDWSAQRFRAAFILRDTRYTENPRLDGFDWSALLGWTLLEGDQNSLGIDLSRSRATLGFADARVLGRPIVDTTSLSVRGALEVVPRWSAIAAVGWLSTANEPASRAVLDFEQTYFESGARYDFRTGSIVDFVWRHSIVDFVVGIPQDTSTNREPYTSCNYP